MIVGTANIDTILLCKHCGSAQQFREYSLSLVPELFRNCHQICNNQLYLCCIELRRANEISWDKKKSIIDECIGIRIFGYLDEIIEINTILSFCDKNKILSYLEVL